ncbi:hypothetical protein EVAR_52702_1 [Eumeta japonica]|uniref:Uncharacterized protein n=1 Tax=Eumeta variegata TaxID=151549 RepID=A0A4C1Y1P5_EUMVA|nr:hypothetical protein EVAR_52702_1 [Eumeta japonica]
MYRQQTDYKNRDIDYGIAREPKDSDCESVRNSEASIDVFLEVTEGVPSSGCRTSFLPDDHFPDKPFVTRHEPTFLTSFSMHFLNVYFGSRSYDLRHHVGVMRLGSSTAVVTNAVTKSRTSTHDPPTDVTVELADPACLTVIPIIGVMMLVVSYIF